jgi:stress-induced morphogen
MPMKDDDIIQLIQDAFPDATVTLKDLVGDQNHYAVTVVSNAFLGKSRVQQHQMVYKSMKGHMGTTLHAMTLETVVKGEGND